MNWKYVIVVIVAVFILLVALLSIEIRTANSLTCHLSSNIPPTKTEFKEFRNGAIAIRGFFQFSRIEDQFRTEYAPLNIKEVISHDLMPNVAGYMVQLTSDCADIHIWFSGYKVCMDVNYGRAIRDDSVHFSFSYCKTLTNDHFEITQRTEFNMNNDWLYSPYELSVIIDRMRFIASPTGYNFTSDLYRVY